jgi:hypothetical protein
MTKSWRGKKDKQSKIKEVGESMPEKKLKRQKGKLKTLKHILKCLRGNFLKSSKMKYRKSGLIKQ